MKRRILTVNLGKCQSLVFLQPRCNYSKKEEFHVTESSEKCQAKIFHAIKFSFNIQVSIIADTPCCYVYWPRQSLEYLLMKEPYLATVLNTIMGRDITNKLYALNERVKVCLKYFCSFSFRLQIKIKVKIKKLYLTLHIRNRQYKVSRAFIATNKVFINKWPSVV